MLGTIEAPLLKNIVLLRRWRRLLDLLLIYDLLLSSRGNDHDLLSLTAISRRRHDALPIPDLIGIDIRHDCVRASLSSIG